MTTNMYNMEGSRQNHNLEQQLIYPSTSHVPYCSENVPPTTSKDPIPFRDHQESVPGYTQVCQTAASLLDTCLSITNNPHEHHQDKKSGEELLKTLCHQIVLLERSNIGITSTIGNTKITSTTDPQYQFEVKDLWDLALKVIWIPQTQQSLAHKLGTASEVLSRCKKQHGCQHLKSHMSQLHQQQLVELYHTTGSPYIKNLQFLPWKYMEQYSVYLHSLTLAQFLHFMAAEAPDLLTVKSFKGFKRRYPAPPLSDGTQPRVQQYLFQTTSPEFIAELVNHHLIPSVEYTSIKPEGWVTLHQATKLLGKKSVTLNLVMEALIHLQLDPELNEFNDNLSTFVRRNATDIVLDPTQLWRLALSDTAQTDRPTRFDPDRRKNGNAALSNWWREAIVSSPKLAGILQILKNYEIDEVELWIQAQQETTDRHYQKTEIQVPVNQVPLTSNTIKLTPLTIEEQGTYFKKIEAMRTTFWSILGSPHTNPQTTKEKQPKEEDRACIENGLTAINILVLHNKGLVLKCVNQFHATTDYMRQILYNAGIQGLRQSIGRYSLLNTTNNRHHCLSTVSYLIIFSHIQQAHADSLGISEHTLEQLSQLRHAKQYLEETLMRPPTLQEIAGHLNISTKQTQKLMQIEINTSEQLSLDMEKQHGPPYYETIGDNRTAEPHDPLQRRWLYTQLAKLPEQSISILTLYFNGYTVPEITKELGLKVQQVTDILNQTITQLKDRASLHFPNHLGQEIREPATSQTS